MKVEKFHNSRIILIRMIFLIVPAMVAGAYVLWYVNEYYSVLANKWLFESIALGAGLICGCFVFNFSLRFLPVFIVLSLLYFATGSIIRNTFTGEFNAFYASTNYYIFSFLFITGFICGWGFVRHRYFPIVLSAILLIVQIVVVSKTSDITTQKLIVAFVPVLLFTLYVVFISETIRRMESEQPGIYWLMAKKIAGFLIVVSLILFCIFSFFHEQFRQIEKEYGAHGTKQESQKDQESLTKQDKDGTVSNKKEMGLSGGRSSSKRLVFIAKLDNYFPGTEVPNPLYFTYDYYTKFDTLTETLEVDSLMPSNDLFQPDPSTIPLYFTREDSSVLKKSKGSLLKKVVTAEVYKSLLSPTEYLAPSTAFFCQPIAVEKEYQDQFKSAYRAKMFVSELNSAYFIYNPAGNAQLEKFQQQRFNELRKVNTWEKEDSLFMHYYTFIPNGSEYDSIRDLAKKITGDSALIIDKIIGIRNYFLSKDENGLPLFKYSDNPGIPGLPSASKLNYFLFQNHKGYCAYYAGATLFLLRSLGIPTRVATGFLTVDRSDKNKGWYWFYEDQAHAWVQVYFPGYGWIDFDTTVPSTEQQQSPAPDGTPPIMVQSAYFVANGKVMAVDTSAKKVTMSVKKLIYHDKSFELSNTVTIELDASIASISRDTGAITLKDLTDSDEVTALSYSEQYKNINIRDSADPMEILSKSPHPAPIDEIKVVNKKKADLQQEKRKQKTSVFKISRLLTATVILLAFLILLIFISPYLIYLLFRYRALNAGSTRRRAYWSYNSALYLLNQFGYTRQGIPVYEFASKEVDPYFNTSLSKFIEVYLKTKYSSQNLSSIEEETIKHFFMQFEKKVMVRIPAKDRISKFLNFSRTIDYFSKPKISAWNQM